MASRRRFNDAIDPELRRWGQAYPRFPGVGECVRIIQAGEARGTWADMIVGELADNADECLAEMIAAFRESSDRNVAVYVMMALENAAIPASVGFLTQVLREGDDHLASYARRALEAIDTRESRKALFDASRLG